jgi:ATP-dependent RNA helicase HelY
MLKSRPCKAPKPSAMDALIAEFAARYPFNLDKFQLEAIGELANRRSVLVAAPTGTGKTVVAEFAVFMALREGQRAFYTTPIKALSNQKFRDFRDQYGADLVGLMTGDIVENPDGQVVIMTTEVLRNMLLQTPEELEKVGIVVFDEVHYLADPERGTTWEEAIICLPKHIQLVCLSATVSNAAELAEWISRVHRPISLVFHNERAVPLEHYFFFKGKLHRFLTADGRVIRMFPGVGGEYRRRNRSGKPAPEPTPVEVLTSLRSEGMLPAIYFLFSRRATEEAAGAAAQRSFFPTRGARRRVEEVVADYLGRLAPEDRRLAQVVKLTGCLERGVAFHHAGLLPLLKVMVEELFNAGLLGAVFATDTLALGINMPAKTVVIGEFTKYDGESRRILTPNEYQQMTGRAGRRGMDEQGYSVILYSPWVAFEEILEVATAPLYPVESAFRVRYNTILNLWLRAGTDRQALRRIEWLLDSSFRQFQLERQLRVLEEELAEVTDNSPQTRRARRLVQEIDRLPLRQNQAMLRSAIRTLRQFGYVQAHYVTDKGMMLADIFDPNGLVIVEALYNGYFDRLESLELAEVLSWFAFDRDIYFFNRLSLPAHLRQLRRHLDRLQQQVIAAEERNGLVLTPGFTPRFWGVVLAWGQGEPLSTLVDRTGLPEGDLILAINKTLDLMRQVRDMVQHNLALIPAIGPGLLERLQTADLTLRRGILEQSLRAMDPRPAEPHVIGAAG